jgi:hypothetical protein
MERDEAVESVFCAKLFKEFNSKLTVPSNFRLNTVLFSSSTRSKRKISEMTLCTVAAVTKLISKYCSRAFEIAVTGENTVVLQNELRDADNRERAGSGMLMPEANYRLVHRVFGHNLVPRSIERRPGPRMTLLSLDHGRVVIKLNILGEFRMLDSARMTELAASETDILVIEKKCVGDGKFMIKSLLLPVSAETALSFAGESPGRSGTGASVDSGESSSGASSETSARRKAQTTGARPPPVWASGAPPWRSGGEGGAPCQAAGRRAG